MDGREKAQVGDMHVGGKDGYVDTVDQQKSETKDATGSDLKQLLCCPFCGRKPDIEPWHGGAPTKHMVSCSAYYQDQCPVMPETTGETKKEAIKNWNTRAV